MDRLPTTGDTRTWHEIASPLQRAKRLGEVIIESIKAVFIDNIPQWSAAISYYTILAAFPLLLVGATVASFFIDPNNAAREISQIIGDFVPEGEQQILDVIQNAIDARSQIGLVSFIGLLWTGSRVFGTMVKALNIAYDVDDPYGFVQRLVIEVIMLLTVGLFFLGALASGFFLDFLWDSVQFMPGDGSMWLDLVRGMSGGLILLSGFFLVYRFMPRTRQNWRSAVFGAIVASVLFIIARPVFLFYMGELSNHDVIYGPVAVLVILMIWIWTTALITLFGGEVAAHFQAMLIDGRSSEDVELRHRRRSPGQKDAAEQDGKGAE